MLNKLKKDLRLVVMTEPDNIISIFDSLSYASSDLDILNEDQRKYLLKKLKPFTYKFKSGRVLVSKEQEYIITIPKQSIISASPVQIVKYQKRKPKEVLVLTPTQAASYLVLNYQGETLLEKLKSLIEKQPVNLKKIKNHIRLEKEAPIFEEIFEELLSFQKLAVERIRANKLLS